MEAIKDALQEELEQTVARLKKLGGAVVFEDYPGALVADGQDDASSDAVSINEQRELAFEVRGRPVERANRLSEALDRLRSGDYGICQICGEPISAGRLQAIPEVTTCVACQDAAERRLSCHARAASAPARRHVTGTGTQPSGQLCAPG